MEIGAQTSAEAKSQVEAVIKVLVEAWNTHDSALYSAQFAEDADFVNVLGMHWHGRSEIEAHHTELHRTIFRNSNLRLLDHSIRPLGPRTMLALVKWEMKGHEAPPAIQFAAIRKGILSAVFLETDGRWLITALQNTEIVPVPGVTK